MTEEPQESSINQSAGSTAPPRETGFEHALVERFAFEALKEQRLARRDGLIDRSVVVERVGLAHGQQCSLVALKLGLLLEALMPVRRAIRLVEEGAGAPDRAGHAQHAGIPRPHARHAGALAFGGASSPAPSPTRRVHPSESDLSWAESVARATNCSTALATP